MKIALTKPSANEVNFGDVVQLESAHTAGVLAFNVN